MQLHLGDLEAAIAGYHQLLKNYPDQPAVIFNLVVAKLRQHRFEDAAVLCRRLHYKHPQDLGVMVMLLTALKGRSAFSEAAWRLPQILQKARRVVAEAADLTSAAHAKSLRPDPLVQQIGELANAMLDFDEPEKALDLIDEALRKSPAVAELHYQRANALLELLRHEEAVQSYERALALRGSLTDAYANLGSALFQLGHFAKALQNFDLALETTAEPGRVLTHVVHAKKFERRDDPHLRRILGILTSSDASGAERMHAHFAAAKALDDLRCYEEALPHLLEGNRVKRKMIQYDGELDAALSGGLSETFDKNFLAEHRKMGLAGQAPIFVFGMPRSGTTLVEQMISAHPDVCAIGESGLFGRALFEVAGDIGTVAQYLERMRQLTPNELKEIGTRFTAAAQARAGTNASRVVEKTVTNYQHAALIQAALPGALLIHVRRDALDNCLSCFSTLFAKGTNYSYDLDELAAYYRRYQSLMGHWKRVIPAEKILTVDYESLVANFEHEARKAIEFCGLPWNSAVLEFNRLDRPIKTASAYQVRQQLYSSSIGRWKKYQQGLAPLERALHLAAVTRVLPTE